MTKEDFTEFLVKMSPLIVKKETIMRKSISPAERLSLTLRYLATGERYKSLSYLSYLYRIPVPNMSLIIPESCSAIFNRLKDEYMKVPSSQADWEKIANEFEDTWNFPNCIGAMDGKHIAIRCPLKSGSNYYNYKQFYSIGLLALVDADYKFKYIDCGCNGRVSDGGVFKFNFISNSGVEYFSYPIRKTFTAEKYTCANCHCWG
uniref:Putative nuclease HARBI1 n=1 Tax=Magallana gigas TaxID=29159 RepID=K1QSK7_MAGGI